MATIYYLDTCSTCKRIIQELSPGPAVQMREIKSEPITVAELDQMKEMAGSYEALFSRRAMKFRQLGLHEQTLTEDDYRDHILAAYTFLKRPVIIVGQEIFIGNSKKQVAAAQAALSS